MPMQSEHPTLGLLRRLMNPLLVVFTLWVCMRLHDEPMDGYYLILAIITFFLSSYLFEDLSMMRPAGGQIWRGFGSVLFAWAMTVGAILFLGYLSRLQHHYYDPVMQYWFVLTPLVLFLGHLGLRFYIGHQYRNGARRRAVIVGGNEAGSRLARRLLDNQYLMTEFLGYFDDRKVERLQEGCRRFYLGHTRELPAYLGKNRVDVVYVSLPISQKERISALLETLKDSTVSVYVVPDIFTYDLIQARIDQIAGVPVIAILETPFTHIHALNKRAADIVLSLLILVMSLPLMLLIAMAVKLTSPGPVIFKQRRYGLNGEEIIVYKFRSMRVTEDGAVIRQASRNDDRITPIGRFLRKSSLDEFPQFFNVLQGRMSIVGPRPHAVSHNETYRKLIKGYMVRHKVKPGITGWAQVNGYRGETETVDKMQKRIEYDLEYLRTWSLGLDLWIIVKTVAVVFSDRNAY